MTGRLGTSTRGHRARPAATDRTGGADRITVALIPKAEDDLRRLQDTTGLSKTDIVNRAISLYEFINAQLRGGQELLIRDSSTGQTQTVLIL
jgi:hypothetical protein